MTLAFPFFSSFSEKNLLKALFSVIFLRIAFFIIIKKELYIDIKKTFTKSIRCSFFFTRSCHNYFSLRKNKKEGLQKKLDFFSCSWFIICRILFRYLSMRFKMMVAWIFNVNGSIFVLEIFIICVKCGVNKNVYLFFLLSILEKLSNKSDSWLFSFYFNLLF